MVELPSALFSTNFWQTQNAMNELYHEELCSPQQSFSLSASPSQPPELDDHGRKSLLSAAAGTHLNHREKNSHNAYERDRRKKLNSLYSSLRTLLPETDQSKKLSIPSTVARILKYIPELQRQVEQLKVKKEELLSKVSNRNKLTSQFTDNSKGSASPAISAFWLSKKEIMVQICLMRRRSTTGISRVLRALEEEGFQLLNASSFATHDGRIFHSLHLQARKTTTLMEGQIFCEQLRNVLQLEESRSGYIRGESTHVITYK
uniref:Protein IRON-RELATED TRANSCRIPTION FACTOR 2 n=1 Tax=Cymbidium goeringii TaxID=112607 RepID=A0A4Y6JL39_9ASPA|nr:transcription factor bHLH100-like isoform X1 [Cymbidium goeringii]